MRNNDDCVRKAKNWNRFKNLIFKNAYKEHEKHLKGLTCEYDLQFGNNYTARKGIVRFQDQRNNKLCIARITYSIFQKYFAVARFG